MKKRTVVFKAANILLAFFISIFHGTSAMERDYNQILREIEDLTRRIHTEVDRVLAAYRHDTAEYHRRMGTTGKKTEAVSTNLLNRNVPNVHEIVPGVYAGQAKVGKETVYFGREKIDAGNCNQWLNYTKSTHLLTTSTEGSLLNLVISSKKNNRPNFNDLIKKRTGFNYLEYEEFMNILHAILAGSDSSSPYSQPTKNIVEALKGVPTGIAGFQSDDHHNYITGNGNYYVVYASKKRVTGKFTFPIDLTECFPLKKYYEHFKDLLIDLLRKLQFEQNFVKR